MTFGRSPRDRGSDGFAAPSGERRLDAPYADGAGDGFGGRAAPGGAAAPAGPTIGASAGTRLAAPDKIDLGETIVGENPTRDVHVFNLHAGLEAGVNVSLTGSPDLLLVGKPDRLRPSREGLGTPIAIMHRPTRRTVSRAVLRVTARWQTDAWPETTIEIPVEARSYAPGQPTHAEESSAAAAQAAARDAAAAGEARDRQGDAAVARENQNDAPYRQGAYNQLHSAYERAKSKLTLVTEEQQQGVEDAGKLVDAFRRRAPRHSQSLLHGLAMFALDAATAGIAGALAVGLGKRVSQLVPSGPQRELVHDTLVWMPSKDVALNPPDLVALVVDSFKEGFKKAGRAGREAAFAAGAGGAAEGVSSGDTIDFFSGLASAVNWSRADRDEALIEAHSRLLPVLRTDPDVAIAAMNAMAEELAAQADRAKSAQLQEASLAWMRYLSQHSLGSLDGKEAARQGLRGGPDGSPITDIRGAVVPPREHSPPDRIDGVVDVPFLADYHHPEAPVTFQKARLTGVHPGMLEELATKTLRQAGLVIRAHGTAAGAAELPVVVVRDEAGNVRFADETAAAGQPSTWLSRKGGSPRPTPERQRTGAVKLMDELLDRTLISLGIGTDHDELGTP